MRPPRLSRTMPLALGLSVALHAAVFTGLTLLPTRPSVLGSAQDQPTTLTLVEVGEENPTVTGSLGPAPATEAPPPPPVRDRQPQPAVAGPPPLPTKPLPKPTIVAPEPVNEQSALHEPAGSATEPETTLTPEIVPAIAALESATPAVTSGQAAVATDGTPASGPAAIMWNTRPSYQFNPKPAYPAVARRQRQEGLVLLLVTVTPEGRPSMVRVSQSSGYALLDEAAQNAVRRWKFAPGRVGRVPVTSEVEVPIQFNLAER